MPFQIIINLLIAVTWMFLNNEWTGVSFTLGYILGLVLLFVLRRFLNARFYLINIYAIVRLFLIFLRELILSNIVVIKQILSPKLDIRPGIFALPTELKSDWEITTLACLITLTPGTLVIDISDDNKTLYIHAMDIPDAEETIAQIKNTFEKAIMEVSK